MANAGEQPKCRVCHVDLSTSASIMSKQVRVCRLCMREELLPLDSGGLGRFCYAHRRVEPIGNFKAKQSRCRVALDDLSRRRLLKAKNVVPCFTDRNGVQKPASSRIDTPSCGREMTLNDTLLRHRAQVENSSVDDILLRAAGNQEEVKTQEQTEQQAANNVVPCFTDRNGVQKPASSRIDTPSCGREMTLNDTLLRHRAQVENSSVDDILLRAAGNQEEVKTQEQTEQQAANGSILSWGQFMTANAPTRGDSAVHRSMHPEQDFPWEHFAPIPSQLFLENIVNADSPKQSSISENDELRIGGASHTTPESDYHFIRDILCPPAQFGAEQTLCIKVPDALTPFATSVTGCDGGGTAATFAATGDASLLDPAVVLELLTQAIPEEQQKPDGDAGAGAGCLFACALREQVIGSSVPPWSHLDTGWNDDAWPSVDPFDTWLTPGSIIMHRFKLSDGGGHGRSGENNSIERVARDIAGGSLFKACEEANARQRTRAGKPLEDEEPPIYLSKDGEVRRVHRNGSTTLVNVLDPAYQAEQNASYYVACSSPAVRYYDIMVRRVPPGLKFEGKFHGGMLVHVEELCRTCSSLPSPGRSVRAAAAAAAEVEDEREDVQIRLHLPARPVGVVRVETIYANGPCKNMLAGAGFPVILVPDENTAEQIRTQLPMPTVAPGTAPDTKSRSCIQHIGYALHAALKGDQNVEGRLREMMTAASRLRMPLLSLLIAVSLNHLDGLLVAEVAGSSDDEAERLETSGYDHGEVIDDPDANDIGNPATAAFVNNAIEYANNRADKNDISTPAKPRTDCGLFEETKMEKNTAKGGSGGAFAAKDEFGGRVTTAVWEKAKPPPNTLAHKLWEIVTFPVQYLVVRRLGVTMSLVFYSRAGVGHTELFAYVLWLVVLDELFLAPLERRQSASDNMITDNRHIGVVQSLNYWLATVLLFVTSPDVKKHFLTNIVYEPGGASNYKMGAVLVYSRFKMAFNDPVLWNVYPFLFVLCVTGVAVSSVYCFARKYGEFYYTGDAPMPSAMEYVCKQWTWWSVVQTLGCVAGNWVAAKLKRGVQHATDVGAVGAKKTKCA